MLGAIVGFIFGIAWLHQQATLPNNTVLYGLTAASVILSLLSFIPVVTLRFTVIKPALRFTAGLAFGVLWSSVFALYGLSRTLPDTLENRDLVITGTVDGLPQPFEEGTRFQFSVEKASAGSQSVTIPENLMLTWGLKYHRTSLPKVPDISPGQRWQLNVRLKRPHGNANPDGFDYELWLFEQGIRATGYVNNDPRLPDKNVLTDSFVSTPMNWVNRVRSVLRERIYRALPNCEYAGVMVALVIGDQKAISQSDWEIFNRTGISHLVAISGLHITMISSLFALFIGLALAALVFHRKTMALDPACPESGRDCRGSHGAGLCRPGRFWRSGQTDALHDHYRGHRPMDRTADTVFTYLACCCRNYLPFRSVGTPATGFLAVVRRSRHDPVCHERKDRKNG